MTDKLSVEKENEVMIFRLLRHAGYDFERDKKKAGGKKAELDPHAVLRMINEKVNREATV